MKYESKMSILGLMNFSIGLKFEFNLKIRKIIFKKNVTLYSVASLAYGQLLFLCLKYEKSPKFISFSIFNLQIDSTFCRVFLKQTEWEG